MDDLCHSSYDLCRGLSLIVISVVLEVVNVMLCDVCIFDLCLVSLVVNEIEMVFFFVFCLCLVVRDLDESCSHSFAIQDVVIWVKVYCRLFGVFSLVVPPFS